MQSAAWLTVPVIHASSWLVLSPSPSLSFPLFPSLSPPHSHPPAGELITALRGRLNDSNKNLIILALSTLANVALAMGPPVDRQSRVRRKTTRWQASDSI